MLKGIFKFILYLEMSYTLTMFQFLSGEIIISYTKNKKPQNPHSGMDMEWSAFIRN